MVNPMAEYLLALHDFHILEQSIYHQASSIYPTHVTATGFRGEQKNKKTPSFQLEGFRGDITCQWSNIPQWSEDLWQIHSWIFSYFSSGSLWNYVN